MNVEAEANKKVYVSDFVAIERCDQSVGLFLQFVFHFFKYMY